MDGSSPSAQDRTQSRGCQDSELERLLREARRGSQTALGLALEAGRKYLLAAANRRLGDRFKAKVGASDLVQDTFLEAHRGFGAFRGRTEQEFHGWLLSILTHRLLNQVRYYEQVQRRQIAKERSLTTFEGASEQLRDPCRTPATELLSRDEQLRVRAAIEKLDEPLKSILFERNWQRLSFVEIAARHDCSPDAARKTWSRAIRKLQILLNDGK